MFISDIKRVVDQISRDKGIDRNILIKALEEALRSAARKKLGNQTDIEVQYSEETGEIEVFQFKEVVETIADPDIEISLEEGKGLDSECEIGDSLGTKMDTTTFGRIAAQSAKQVIIQKMKDAERDAVYAGYIDRKGEIINGIVQRFDRGEIVVNLGNTEGILPRREQVPRETYRRGDRIRALILDVLHDTRGPQVLLTRTHPDFLVMLFKTEVPEISEGVVSIMGAAREPGSRAKFAVASNDSDIDPVGACVGMKGSRVQNVVQELRGEKIDIIPYHVDAAKFVCNALAPADISRVIIDEANRSMEVIVPDESLSVAIGKRGQNVRLASKLSGWRLDVKSEAKYSQDMKDGYESLMALPGVSIGVADALYEKGFYSADEIAGSSVEELTQIRDLSEEDAAALIKSAQVYVTTAQEDAEKAAEEDAEKAAEEDAEKAAEEDAEKAAEEDAEKAAEEDAEKAAEEDAEKAAEEDAEKAAEEDVEKVAEEDVEKAAEEDVEKAEQEDVEKVEPEVEDSTQNPQPDSAKEASDIEEAVSSVSPSEAEDQDDQDK